MSIGIRNRRIDLIRGVSILLVLLHHFNIAYHLSDTLLGTILTPGGIRAIVRNGNYGVTMFFVISGFLITSNAEKRWGELRHVGMRTFYGLRIARIVPCLLLLLVTVDLLAFGGLSMFRSHAEGSTAPFSMLLVNLAALTFWMNVLLAQSGWVNYPLGVLWSLSIEEVFYISFPIICLVLRRDRFIAAFWLVIVAIGPLYRLTHQADESGFLYAYFASFDGIAIGCCTALLARRVRLDGLTARLLQPAIIAGMVFLYLIGSIGETNVYGVTLMALGTATLLLAANTNSSGPAASRNRGLRMVEWFGRLSYELYLFHLIVLALMRTMLPPRAVAGQEKLLLLAVFLALSAALAIAIGRFYAEPLNRRIRRLLAVDRTRTDPVPARSMT
ncbi:acyltransferase [Lichenicola cladoniae]|uniref:Acyltransferase n=1 Tax=Lichenicola cladoniae TaxID=1484109 RepID=A0A6M8HTY0_9PROT|nr:acyltransferase [Lichenicola cladoniae]NPD66090.1 acyltransferase [Acetobacteraceae bacterium]QKE91963.1 acyltransferase [Lichenicola cladoniae]